MEKDDSDNFTGFSDDDEVRSSLQAKLERIKQMQNMGQLHGNPKAEPGTQVRPMNRFLNRSSSGSVTPMKNASIKPLISPSVQKANTAPSAKTAVISMAHVEPVASNIKTKIASTPSVTVPPSPDIVQGFSSRVRRPSNNFLKKVNPPVKRAEDSVTNQKDVNLSIKKSVERVIPSVKLATEVRAEPATPLLTAKAVNESIQKLTNQVEPSDGKKTAAIPSKVKVVPNEKTPSASETLAPAQSDAVPVKDSNERGLSSVTKKPTGNNGASANKPKANNKPSPSPAKRAASVSSEFSFLSGQSARSKRTIVPNKRFFSVDSESPLPVSKPTETRGRETSPTNAMKFPKKPVQNGQIKLVETSVPTKKRSVSGDNAKRKRKLSSSEVASVSNGISSTTPKPIETQTQPMDPNARPRRTIIPNRKFMDEEEIVKEPISKVMKAAHGNDEGELKRKRRKSEKSNVHIPSPEKDKVNTVLPLPSPPLAPKFVQSPTNAPAPALKINSPPIPPLVKENIGAKTIQPIVRTIPPQTQTVAPANAPNENGNGMSFKETASTVITLELKTPVVAEAVEVKLDDELPITENELTTFGSELKFSGTCIVKPDEPKLDGTDSVYSSGIIRCGVCDRIKRYRNIPEKKKRGSFLCADCSDVVPKIYAGAMKAKPFNAIPGPPVCEGQCPLVFKPADQFCQACFAKTCLKKLPMKDDIYFKVWRSIPPMSRGCVSTVPVTNPNTPLMGKVVFVDDNAVVKSVAGSLKAFIGKKPANGVADSTSEDSNDIPVNGEDADDLNQNSARITTFSPRPGPSNKCENTFPSRTSESLQASSIDTLIKEVTNKSNGVMKEELIFCSLCCEPYHPYCAGDDLLLDTYIARCEDGSSKEIPAKTVETCSQGSVCSDPSRLSLKWTCRRCLSCKGCGDCIGSKELIRCNRCQNPYHLNTCIDKQILNRIKSRSKLKKAWTCDTCLKCKSCGKLIEPNRRLKAIQEVAAAESSSEGETDSEDEDKEAQNTEGSASMFSCIMLCLECFKQRKKGSYCPICEVCYDDNDWDSKMMECCTCNRWIHASCEKLTDEQYHILGKLPEYIEYICKLCHASATNPLWYDAIQSQLIKDCNSAVRLFEQKSLGASRRKRSSSDVKPSYVCNLFGDGSSVREAEQSVEDNLLIDEMDESVSKVVEVPEPETTQITLIVKKEPLEKLEEAEEKRLFRKNLTRTVTYKEMMDCKVQVRNYVKFPKTQEEKWYAMKFLGVEVAECNPACVKVVNSKQSATPIQLTPKKLFTPSKHVSAITNVMNNIGSVTSLKIFQKTLISTIVKTCKSESDQELLIKNATSAMQETFPWFEPCSSVARDESTEEDDVSSRIDESGEERDDLAKESHCNGAVLTNNPFKECYWDPLDFFDDRLCSLCGEVGDFPPEQLGRLLWCGMNEWIHCNCAIWSSEVWELESGALQQVGSALNRGKNMRCKVCKEKGATVSCCHSTCKNSYHFKCAKEADCFLFENKTMFCSHHKLTPKQNDEVQDDMKVGRKVFVDLDWMQKRGLKGYSDDIRIFVGSMKVDCLGSIVPISVTPKAWTQSPETLLIPRDFVSHRIFWSLNDPWSKECYTFQTGISCNGFPKKIQDPEINLVVNHSKKTASVNRGFDTIRNFHQWVKKVPKYIDEDMVEWMAPCTKEFSVTDDEEEESGIDSYDGKGRSSPSLSISSVGSGSITQVLSGSLKRTPYALRKIPGRIQVNCESQCTEGYTSSASADSSVIETPKSSRLTRQMKRRRSSFKTRKPPKKRLKLSTKESYESPRRRSMRNLHLKESVSAKPWAVKSMIGDKDVDDSDNDSGVTEVTTSSTGNYDEDHKLTCRVNLLDQFNASFEEELTIRKQDENDGDGDTVQVDTMSVSSTSIDPGINSNNVSQNMNLSQLSDETEGKVFSAVINFEVKRRNAAICCSCDARQAWMFLFEEVCKTRRQYNLTELVHPALNVKLCDNYMDEVNSLRMIGISHRSVQYLLEQLPSVLCVVGRHNFHYSHRPYVDPNNENVVLPRNSTGSARSEGLTRRKPFDMFGWLASKHRKVSLKCEGPEESSRSQGLPLAMQFRDLKEKARKRFVVLYSDIHGRGLFARCDMEKGEMLIEYAGEVIRHSLSDPRERYYESKGIGCYMFRIKTQVIDATMKGNAARFINHSCEPNCEAKTVRILGMDHIIIFALRKIFKGEELTYDYKFEREEDKIPCSCGAARCRKYMN